LCRVVCELHPCERPLLFADVRVGGLAGLKGHLGLDHFLQLYEDLIYYSHKVLIY